MYTSQIVNILCWACSGVSSTKGKDYERIPYNVKQQTTPRKVCKTEYVNSLPEAYLSRRQKQT